MKSLGIAVLGLAFATPAAATVVLDESGVFDSYTHFPIGWSYVDPAKRYRLSLAASAPVFASAVLEGGFCYEEMAPTAGSNGSSATITTRSSGSAKEVVSPRASPLSATATAAPPVSATICASTGTGSNSPVCSLIPSSGASATASASSNPPFPNRQPGP